MLHGCFGVSDVVSLVVELASGLSSLYSVVVLSIAQLDKVAAWLLVLLVVSQALIKSQQVFFLPFFPAFIARLLYYCVVVRSSLKIV